MNIRERHAGKSVHGSQSGARDARGRPVPQHHSVVGQLDKSTTRRHGKILYLCTVLPLPQPYPQSHTLGAIPADLRLRTSTIS